MSLSKNILNCMVQFTAVIVNYLLTNNLYVHVHLDNTKDMLEKFILRVGGIVCLFNGGVIWQIWQNLSQYYTMGLIMHMTLTHSVSFSLAAFLRLLCIEILQSNLKITSLSGGNQEIVCRGFQCLVLGCSS